MAGTIKAGLIFGKHNKWFNSEFLESYLDRPTQHHKCCETMQYTYKFAMYHFVVILTTMMRTLI